MSQSSNLNITSLNDGLNAFMVEDPEAISSNTFVLVWVVDGLVKAQQLVGLQCDTNILFTDGKDTWARVLGMGEGDGNMWVVFVLGDGDPETGHLISVKFQSLKPGEYHPPEDLTVIGPNTVLERIAELLPGLQLPAAEPVV